MTAAGSPGADGTRVRRATARDASVVASLEEDGLGDDAWSYGLLSEVVGGTLPTVHALVAEVDGEVVGYVAGSLVVDVAELQRLVVAAPARRHGVARALLDALTALARDTGAARLLLEVRADNEGARAFYAAAGFAEVGTRPRYYRDGESALVLERPVPAR